LRLIQGGAGDAPVPAVVYWCRRLAALVLAVTCVVAVAVGAHAGLTALVASPGGHGPSASGVTRAAGAPTHVVEPGETLWSIAAGLGGDGDIRRTVDELVGLNGGPAVEVGQRLALPSAPG